MYIHLSVCRGRGGIPCIFTTLCVEVGRYTMYIHHSVCRCRGGIPCIFTSLCKDVGEVYHVYSPLCV